MKQNTQWHCPECQLSVQAQKGDAFRYYPLGKPCSTCNQPMVLMTPEVERDVNFLLNHITLLCYNLPLNEWLAEVGATLYSDSIKRLVRQRILNHSKGQV